MYIYCLYALKNVYMCVYVFTYVCVYTQAKYFPEYIFKIFIWLLNVI
jgi:hypothetical protein